MGLSTAPYHTGTVACTLTLPNPRPVKSTGAVPVEGLAVIPGQSGHLTNYIVNN